MTARQTKFLTAQWKHLAMVNFEIDPKVLLPRLPRGTELDLFKGRALVSLVGFMFLDTRVLGVAIPGHRNFEELNLRFYVTRRVEGEIRRGVVFVKEIVPRAAVTFVARALYNENYVTLPMQHETEMPSDGNGPAAASYRWRIGGEWQSLTVRATGHARKPSSGSEEEFITEHYWGYATQRDGGAVEYRVEHPPWNVWSHGEAIYQADPKLLYGEDFAAALSQRPTSAFLVDGSAVTVFRGVRL